jgi:carbonic anhydrase
MRVLAVALAFAGFLTACGDDEASGPADAGAGAEPAWGYEGKTGPSNWSRLGTAYADCAGQLQSPIDLSSGQSLPPPRLEVAYEPSAATVENNGRSLEVAYARGGSIELDGTAFELVQSHFHAPSEHTLEGRRYPLEFHLVHEADDGTRAVLGVFALRGGSNRLLGALAEVLPVQEGQKRPLGRKANPLDLLPDQPANARRWSYEGSLTTPPCTEGVRWTVFEQPIEVSGEQLSVLTSAYSRNNRPLQSRNDRELLVGR